MVEAVLEVVFDLVVNIDHARLFLVIEACRERLEVFDAAAGECKHVFEGRAVEQCLAA